MVGTREESERDSGFIWCADDALCTDSVLAVFPTPSVGLSSGLEKLLALTSLECSGKWEIAGPSESQLEAVALIAELDRMSGSGGDEDEVRELTTGCPRPRSSFPLSMLLSSEWASDAASSEDEPVAGEGDVVMEGVDGPLPFDKVDVPVIRASRLLPLDRAPELPVDLLNGFMRFGLGGGDGVVMGDCEGCVAVDIAPERACIAYDGKKGGAFKTEASHKGTTVFSM